MNAKTIRLISGTAFILISLGHLLRLIFAWRVTVGTWSVPMWISWLALFLSCFLSYQCFSLGRARTELPDSRASHVAPNLLRIERVVVWSAIVATGIMLVVAYMSEVKHLSPGADIVELTDYAKEALQFKREQINALAQLAILIVGGLWAMLLGPENPPSLTNRSWAVFATANVLLGSSYLFYLRATSQLIEYLFKAKTIDLESPKVILYSTFQVFTFSAGLGYAVLCALLIYLRRRRAT